jgi:glycosyltransferase involved in cell wall biosynthesis
VRVVHVSLVRPRERVDPDSLLASWPTLTDVAQAVARAVAEVTVVQSFHRDAEVVRGDVRFQFVAEPALPGRATGLAPRRIAAAVNRSNPDVNHVNGLDFAGHTRALCKLGVPVLAQDHASVPGVRRLSRRWALSNVDAVAFTHPDQAAPFVADGSLQRATPVFSVPESSTRFTPGPQAEARAETGVYGDPAVLWVGRLDRNKDPLTVLGAIERASAALPGLRLWCCFHEQPLLGQVSDRIETSQALRGRVHLLGKVARGRVQALCRASDFFMLASQRESSGYSLIEAIACGTTPIVSDIPPFRALTGDGSIGALVQPGHAEGFADALVELAGRPRDELRRKALVHFERSLSFDRVGSRLVEIYSKLRGCR